MARKESSGDRLYLWLAATFLVVGLLLWMFGAAESSVALRYAQQGEVHAGGLGYLGLGTGLLAIGAAFGTIFLMRRD